MKPSPFTHHQPHTLEDAVSLLAQLADQDGRILAGGQTLMPAMALRLARPQHLIDINRIDALQWFHEVDGQLQIGACVRHASFHEPVENGVLGQLLAAVVRHIAHLPVRNRGTFCGSLANADGASEWCLTALALDATLVAHSTRGRRDIPAAEFFVGAMTTALAPDEILSAAHLPLLPATTRFGFEEFSRRAGDFAQAMSLVVYEASPDGTLQHVRIGIGGVAGTPVRAAGAEALLEGQAPSDALFARAADLAAADVDPSDTGDDERAYRRALTHTVVARALARAHSSR